MLFDDAVPSRTPACSRRWPALPGGIGEPDFCNVASGCQKEVVEERPALSLRVWIDAATWRFGSFADRLTVLSAATP